MRFSSTFSAVICALLGGMFLYRLLKNATKKPLSYDDERVDIVRCEQPPDLARSSFGFGPGVEVRGWPSTGGFYILDSCDGVMLDFLGLDRFHETKRSTNATEEDEHCDRMRMLGAKWWSTRWEWAEWEIVTPHHIKLLEKVLITGWPDTGGVWVLNTTLREAARKRTGCLSNARDMDERCRLMEKLGAIFYQNPEDCPHLELSTPRAAGSNNQSDIHSSGVTLPSPTLGH